MVKLEMDCGAKCRSKEHLYELIVAVSKGSVRQTKVYLSQCSNLLQGTDDLGRTGSASNYSLHLESFCFSACVFSDVFT